jgi:ABC-type transport system substrate-binding protein
MNRFVLLACATSVMLACAVAQAQQKVLRYAFPIAETGFDPAQISDLYSRTIAQGIFEAPLTYDFLARPATVKPQTAAELPEVSDDFTRFTFRIKPGIYFADDLAFKGVRRELTAADYVYSVKRHYDPKFKSPSLFQLENARILGLSELRKKSLADKTPFPYDTEVQGLRVLDRYRFEVRVAQPQPRLLYHFADGAVTGAVAREVMEAYAGKEMEHPVGTGPFRLSEWRRSAKIMLQRNPNYREVFYDEQPGDNAAAQAIAAKFKGRRLPMVDQVEISIIEEEQPRLLAFLNNEHDFLERLRGESTDLTIPNNKLAPNLAKRGVQLERVPLVDITHFYFGLEHPVVGGYTPDKVALRRAISLAYDSALEIQVVRHNQAVPAQSIFAPLTLGYDATLKTEMSDHDLARAKALLDIHGYVDKNGDGWRDQPNGQPLVLEYSSQPDQISRRLQEVLKKSMNALKVRVEVKIAKWPEQLKSSRAGKLMMWGLGWGGANPDGQYNLDLLYGPNKGQANHARFDLPAFNALYEKQAVMPDGPEREAVMREAALLGVAYMPYKVTGHRIAVDLMQAPLVGYQRHPFMREWWRYVDIAAPEAAQRKP